MNNKSFREERIGKRQCPSCEAAIINGVYCHEAGCPDAHLFSKQECPWCGVIFIAEERGQRFCSDDCSENHSL
jgi:hypothetical protein